MGISTHRLTKELKFEEMGLSWKSLLTCGYYGEIWSNSVWTASKNPPFFPFLRMRNSLFSIRKDKLKPKQLRLPFQESFFRISSGTYLTHQKKYCGNRCELSNWSWAAITWQWSSSHLLSLKSSLSLPPRLATPLEKKAEHAYSFSRCVIAECLY